MKITEEKHNHKLTNLLKIFIFSVLMLLPFLNVAVRCGYVMLNKNAYQSYTETTYITYQPVYYDSNEVNNVNDLLVGNIYYYTNNIEENFQYTDYYIEVEKTLFQKQNPSITLEDIIKVTMYSSISDNKTNIYYRVETNNGNQYININAKPNYFIIVDFKNKNNIPDMLVQHIEQTDFKYLKEYIEVTQNGTLDNVFEYSLNRLEEEQYLTWTQNTAVYQGVESMTTGLGITQTVVPMLIVYWFMLTIIYVIIDIVLAIFTKLTHMIGNKTT